MWEVVGYAAACLALVFLCALLPTVMGLPDVIAKYLSGRLGSSEIDKRLKDLEAQVQALRAPNPP